MLDVNWLLQTCTMLRKVKLGKRLRLKCLFCFNRILEAQKYSRNGQVLIADGVKCDGKKSWK